MKTEYSKKILVADDETGITKLVSAYLKRDNFHVFTANDGLDAYDLYVEKKPDLLILDIMMPKLDGLALVEIIRKESKVPIILLTAKTEEQDRIGGFKYGIDDYVSKPFSPGELIERVKALLRRTYPEPEVLTTDYGPFVIRHQEHRIYFHGKELPLTNAQFDILTKFILSPGQVFTREQLHSILNIPEPLEFSRSIDVQINNIRKLISLHHGDSQIIQTHRGIGYSLRGGL